jgi:hypothetical protein
MLVAAVVLGVAFAAAHAWAGVSWLIQRPPPASRGSGEPGAIPTWARYAWLVAAAAVLGGSITLPASGTVAAGLVALGAVAIAVLAIANGYWLKGKPTLSHHVGRFALVALLLVTVAVAVR